MRIFLSPVFTISCVYTLIIAPSCSMLVPFGKHQTSAIFDTLLGGNLMRIFRVWIDNWKPSDSMVNTLSHFVQATDTWNKTVFGYIDMKKWIIMACLRRIQKALCSCTSTFLRSLESELLLELEYLLDQEELLWRQKSRSNWILQGDRNTCYFHRRAINRKQWNIISTLKLSDGTWCDENLTLQEEATHYFKSLFSKENTPKEPFRSELSFPTLHDSLL
ncbi:hypothetical protein V6N13_148484 [Hibiscus sabdariffa]